MNYAVDLQGLHKTYGGKTALEDITLQVKEGSCYGLLGPNGAGKSTTMKLLSGLIQPDRGTASVFGKDVLRGDESVKELIGYVPQSITLYEKLSALDNLTFFGELYGVRGAELKRRIEAVLEKVGLAERAKDPVAEFSGGMKRRINIAAALLHKPKLIIMDEPTVGIDPQSRNHIFEMIRGLNRDGVTVLYSTHYMEEVEALCDELAIIDHGKVLTEGTLDGVLSRHGAHAVYVESEPFVEAPVFAGVGAASAQGKGWVVETEEPLQALARIAAGCQEQGVTVKQLEIVRPSLETVFLSLTGTTLRDT
ncbi:ABC transporter ATP-binding protein [Paenibacillus beijingensis]|uniref:ABC transporter ATP-binding protein n=1 Tax=Paenibacillus beijingensis TaxID=1126833 RepID=A0A0D5NFB0_9BACL|nr:ABC transporter ATP-binding protein [Paenibacillus beijingensis]AJY74079.1 ABC transporter ATP-binding protein [Paenibacillus beijingensis]